MFKLLKIIGANDSAPEIITVNVPADTAIKAGNVYFLSNGSVSCDRPKEAVRFVALETIDQTGKQKKLHGFLITPGMVFEADFEGDIGFLFAGEPFSFYRTDYDTISSICLASDETGCVEGIVYSQEGSARANKLQVLFT